MYQVNGGGPCADECNHMRTVEDHNTGDTVCTACGLCIGPVFAPSYRDAIRSGPVHSTDNSYIRDLILDICEHLDMPTSQADYACWIYKTIIPQLFGSKWSNARWSTTVAAYAVFESSVRHQSPRTPQEVSFFAGVTTTDLWAVERSLSSNVDDAKPSEYVSRYCDWLGLRHFPYQSAIKEIVDNMYGMRDSRSSCIVACVIFLFSKEHDLKLSMKTVCETCAVSASSVQNLMKKMSPRHIKQISLLSSNNCPST